MIRHMHYQNGVHCFGDTFAPFIMASILLVFTLCLPLFYAVIKTGMSNVVDLAVFLGNGIQILIRYGIDTAHTANLTKTRPLLVAYAFCTRTAPPTRRPSLRSGGYSLTCTS